MENKDNVKRVLIISVVVSAALVFLTWLLVPRLDNTIHLPDKGAHWYFWQRADPNFISRLSAWLGYSLHQVFIWLLIIKARKNDRTGSGVVSRYNIAALLINLVFILLHMLQTQIWYDGLAQDVPIWTSQGSVIVMLVLTLVMLTPRRGFIIGKKISLPTRSIKFLNIFHGFFISWALIYTFWFHPMDGSYGLLSGFFYMFLLFTQLSLFNTKLHLNMKWLVVLETMVAVHGTLITLEKANPIWPMFLSGFLFMFAFTYIFGLTKNKLIRIGVIILYIAGVIVMYNVRGFNNLYEVSFIPAALYGGGIVLILLLKLAGKKKAD
ncbi:MAG: hypothetical protein PQJ61_13530 [Spirochaetales bacterium]|uniref:Serine active site containing 1-like protein n=1 Tax=Candidatus Thalassospirochaeta sargassi TaxID=3119039 RepID=A0AAJ1MNI0_9SPIO|nr:hypothetical protein [Spirochaetales bacterium]